MAEQRSGRIGGSRGQGGPNKIFYGLLGLVVIAGVAWLLVADGGEEVGTSPAAPITDLAGVEADPAVGLALGRENAPVTILEFADYSCPHCAQFAAFNGRLLRQNFVEGGGPVRWVLYDYVLGSFPNSVSASLAARCAGEQGRYWPMHDLLLARQARWARESSPGGVYRDLAEEIGLDRGQFDECMDERRYLEEIAAARKYGDQLGVNSTPTLFLNGRQLDLQTEGSYEVLERLIEAAVDSAAAAGSSEG